jgi:hypothetical protein
MKKGFKGLHELYAVAQLKADRLIWGRETAVDIRRGAQEIGPLGSGRIGLMPPSCRGQSHKLLSAIVFACH